MKSIQIRVSRATYLIACVAALAGGVHAARALPPAIAIGFRQAPETNLAYRLDLATGGLTLLGDTGYRQLNSLARSPSGEFFSIGIGQPTTRVSLVRIDPHSGQGQEVVQVTGLGQFFTSIAGLAFAPTGRLFGVFARPPGMVDRLITIDPATGATAVVGDMNHGSIQSLEFTPDGFLYGWDLASGLLRIDAVTAASTKVTSDTLGDSIQSISFAPSGELYGAWGYTYAIDSAGVAHQEHLIPESVDVRGFEFIPEPATASLLMLAVLGANRSAARRRHASADPRHVA